MERFQKRKSYCGYELINFNRTVGCVFGKGDRVYVRPLLHMYGEPCDTEAVQIRDAGTYQVCITAAHPDEFVRTFAPLRY